MKYRIIFYLDIDSKDNLDSIDRIDSMGIINTTFSIYCIDTM